MLRRFGVFAVVFLLCLLLLPAAWAGASALAKDILADTADPLTRAIPGPPRVEIAPFENARSFVEAGVERRMAERREARQPARILLRAAGKEGELLLPTEELQVTVIETKTGIEQSHTAVVLDRILDLGQLPPGEFTVCVHERGVPARIGYLQSAHVRVDERGAAPDPVTIDLSLQAAWIGSPRSDRKDPPRFALTLHRIDDDRWMRLTPPHELAAAGDELTWREGTRVGLGILGAGDYELRFLPLDVPGPAPRNAVPSSSPLEPVRFTIPSGDVTEILEIPVEVPAGDG
jgi:hypothetical protein